MPRTCASPRFLPQACGVTWFKARTLFAWLCGSFGDVLACFGLSASLPVRISAAAAKAAPPNRIASIQRQSSQQIVSQESVSLPSQRVANVTGSERFLVR